MTFTHALGVIAVAQIVFGGLIIALLLVKRAGDVTRRARGAAAARAVSAPVRAWLVGETSARAVADGLRQSSPDLALAQAVIIASARVPAAELEELASVLRGEWWVSSVLQRAGSRFWWRRLDAARMLAIVASPSDRDLLLRLLADPHAAVQVAASSSLPRVAERDVIAAVIEGLPRRSVVVRLYQFGALRELWRVSGPVLLEYLRADAPPESLEIWVSLADALGTPECLARALELRSHPEPKVRIAVTRALKRYFHPAAEPALLALLADADWRVRGQAARALGVVGTPAAIPALVTALCDRSWWVRFRSALALSQLGEPGRRALREARHLPDRYAAEMASMVSGLSEGGSWSWPTTSCSSTSWRSTRSTRCCCSSRSRSCGRTGTWPTTSTSAGCSAPRRCRRSASSCRRTTRRSRSSRACSPS